MPLDEPNSKKELKSEGIFHEYGIIFCYAGLGLVTAYKTFLDSEIVLCIIVSILTVFIVFFRYSKNRNKHETIQNNNNTDKPMEVLLESLHGIVLNARINNPDNHGLRLTIYRLSNDGKHLIQHTKYFGEHNQKLGERHEISVSKGVIGLAYRSKENQFVKRPENSTHEHFVQYMVNDFGYTEDEAIQLQRDRFSWAAVPIVEDSGVHTVLFCDSRIHNFFGQKSNDIRRRILLAACAGLVKYLAK